MELPDLDVIFKDNGTSAGARSVISDDNTLSGLGELLRLAREQLGLGLREASRVTGLSPAQLLRVERGVDARMSTYLSLAQAYDCRLGVFLTFIRPMRELWYKVNVRRQAGEDERRAARHARYWRKRGWTPRASLPAA